MVDLYGIQYWSMCGHTVMVDLYGIQYWSMCGHTVMVDLYGITQGHIAGILILWPIGVEEGRLEASERASKHFSPQLIFYLCHLSKRGVVPNSWGLCGRTYLHTPGGSPDYRLLSAVAIQGVVVCLQVVLWYACRWCCGLSGKHHARCCGLLAGGAAVVLSLPSPSLQAVGIIRQLIQIEPRGAPSVTSAAALGVRPGGC
uniref:Uncharacterized protein n=1 Tax=Timema cristinae TaxID=61476 RepID=A0A7R9CPJ8_TIMCR|nr:unnamed protein product [Timema cristinae]